jgi:hypothetical protein
LSVIDADGLILRKIPVQQFSTGPRVVEAVSADCSSVLLLDGEDVLEPYPRYFRQSIVLYWQSLDGQRADTILTFSGPERVSIEFDDRTLPIVLPWSNHPTWSVRNDQVVFGPADKPRYMRFGRDGRLTHIVEWFRTPASVTANDRATYSRRREELQRTEPSALRFLPEIVDYPILPEVKPVYDRLLVDELDNVWLRAYPDYVAGMPGVFQAPDSVKQDHWWVFGPSGIPIGDIIIPARLHIEQITTNDVVGVWRDSLDVESIRIYRVHK